MCQADADECTCLETTLPGQSTLPLLGHVKKQSAERHGWCKRIWRLVLQMDTSMPLSATQQQLTWCRCRNLSRDAWQDLRVLPSMASNRDALQRTHGSCSPAPSSTKHALQRLLGSCYPASIRSCCRHASNMCARPSSRCPPALLNSRFTPALQAEEVHTEAGAGCPLRAEVLTCWPTPPPGI